MFLCSTNCTQECKSTKYGGSTSFSQISSQATDSVLGLKGYQITNDYVNSIELSHRLFHDIDLVYTVSDLHYMTTVLLTKIDSFTYAASSFNNGFKKFINYFVSSDIEKLQVILANFQSTYISAYKVSRHLAMKYLSQTTRNFQDLSHEMRGAPKSNSSFYDAQRFYTSFYSLLSKCIVSSRLASSYLSQALIDELRNTHLEYSPGSLYHDAFEATSCNKTYTNILQSLEIIEPFLSYSSQKISVWLKENSQSIIFATAAKFLNASMNAAVFVDNDNASSDVLDLWTLLVCNSCNTTEKLINYSSWIKLVHNLIKFSATLPSCLLAYNDALKMTYIATEQLKTATPTWSLGDILSAYTTSLKQQAQSLNANTHSYITGVSALQDALSIVENIVKYMHTNVTAIEEKIASSSEQWLNDVARWRSDITTLYESIVSSLVSLYQFMPGNTNLTETVRLLSIWNINTVLLDIVYYDDSPLLSLPYFIDLFNYNLTQFLQYQASNATNIIFANLVRSNINYAKQSQRELQSLCNAWFAQVDNLTNLIYQAKTDFSINDAFIR